MRTLIILMMEISELDDNSFHFGLVYNETIYFIF